MAPRPPRTPEDTARELQALQLRDLKARRQNHAERRVLWVIAAVLLYVALKSQGLV